MIPLRDTTHAQRTPVVTIALVVVNVVVFAYELRLGPAVVALVTEWGLVPARLFARPFEPAAAATLVTSMFLHGGWLHLVGNMLYLWVFGDNVEDRLGRGRFLVFYASCGIAAGLVQAVSSPASVAPMVGASGAVAGVLGAYFLLFPHARVLTLVPILFYPWFVQVPAVVFLGLWFVLQLVRGWAVGGLAEASTEGVAWWAHTGGFVAGLAWVVLFPPRRRRVVRPRR